jgi:hypothetical protein
MSKRGPVQFRRHLACGHTKKRTPGAKWAAYPLWPRCPLVSSPSNPEPHTPCRPLLTLEEQVAPGVWVEIPIPPAMASCKRGGKKRTFGRVDVETVVENGRIVRRLVEAKKAA